MAKHSIPVVVRTQDNGDGGYSIYAYNTEEEMLADHPKSEDGELTEEQKQEILTEDDPYANGYISHDTVEVEVGKDGVAKLVGHIHFHAGQ